MLGVDGRSWSVTIQFLARTRYGHWLVKYWLESCYPPVGFHHKPSVCESSYARPTLAAHMLILSQGWRTDPTGVSPCLCLQLHGWERFNELNISSTLNPADSHCSRLDNSMSPFTSTLLSPCTVSDPRLSSFLLLSACMATHKKRLAVPSPM